MNDISFESTNDVKMFIIYSLNYDITMEAYNINDILIQRKRKNFYLSTSVADLLECVLRIYYDIAPCEWNNNGI